MGSQVEDQQVNRTDGKNGEYKKVFLKSSKRYNELRKGMAVLITKAKGQYMKKHPSFHCITTK
jgi:hypothetical protein